MVQSTMVVFAFTGNILVRATTLVGALIIVGRTPYVPTKLKIIIIGEPFMLLENTMNHSSLNKKYQDLH